MRHDKQEPPGTGVPQDSTELESLIRAVPLKAPPRQLDARVWQLLEHSRANLWRGTMLTGLAAAIAFLIVWSGWLYHRHASGSPIASRSAEVTATAVASASRPLRIERDASTLADGGIVGFAGKIPLHGYRVRDVRQIWYVDPNGKRLCVTVPTERVVLVPVHTF